MTRAPGADEIAVSGTNFRTGPASFRLLDLGTAAPLAIGQPVSGSLHPVAETDMFRFEAVAGGRIYFQNMLGISNAKLRIIGPNGNQTQTPTGVGDREFTADKRGTNMVDKKGDMWRKSGTLIE